MKKRAHKPTQKIDRDFMENALVDTMRLRAALLMACTELCCGDPLEGWGLAEEFYDMAPKLIDSMMETGAKLPCGPAQVLQFPNKSEQE